jgi:hypothetical protein
MGTRGNVALCGMAPPFPQSVRQTIETTPLWLRVGPRPLSLPSALDCSFGGYLVDPASSHMLVSKIKPCMSKYKLLIL